MVHLFGGVAGPEVGQRGDALQQVHKHARRGRGARVCRAGARGAGLRCLRGGAGAPALFQSGPELRTRARRRAMLSSGPCMPSARGDPRAIARRPVPGLDGEGAAQQRQ